MNILSNMSEYIVEASIEHIKLRAQIDGGSIKFSVNLEKGTSQDFWKIITKPLYISSMEIIRQHKFLLDLIKKKDKEIAEYKAEGAELIRSMLFSFMLSILYYINLIHIFIFIQKILKQNFLRRNNLK